MFVQSLLRAVGAAGIILGVSATEPFILGAQTKMQPKDSGPAMTWQSLETRVQSEVDDGFVGVGLVARDGKIVLHKAFGVANREKRIAMRPDSILAIGSTPIDFTKAGILLLAEKGKLSLSDPITKFFDNVPEDKRPITVRHLMTGRS